jgi:hypothetical protein
VGLDEAVAVEEARRAAEAEAKRQNLEALDLAAQRFAELAVERGIHPSGLNGLVGWLIDMPLVTTLLVYPDGTWDSYFDAIAKGVERRLEDGNEDSALLQSTGDAVARMRSNAGKIPAPDATAVEEAMARMLVEAAQGSQ